MAPQYMANCYEGKRIQNITQTLELFKAAEENYCDDAAVESFVFRYTRTPKECLQYSNISKYTIYAHNNQKFGPQGGHGRRKFFDGFSSF